ncbi:MAG: ISAs1 family transposase, partial [Spirochaetaceae bacterium]|nr:ISAs1 family transposase [Spirochaetaceae bacterium]
LLDVRFGEDFCRIEDKNARQNLNIARKIVLNTLRDYKNKTSSKRPFSKLMLDCLLDTQHILSFLAVNEN